MADPNNPIVADLAAITIDPAFTRLGAGGTPISIADATAIIKADLLDIPGADGVKKGNVQKFAAQLAESIAQALPDTMLYDTTVHALDLRPYIATNAKSLDPDGTHGWANPDGTYGDIFGILIAAQNTKIDNTVRDQAVTGQLTPEQIESARASSTAFDPGTVTPNATSRLASVMGASVSEGAAQPATPQDAIDFVATGTGSFADVLASIDEGAPPEPFPGFDVEGLRKLWRTGLVNFMDVINAEASYNSDPAKAQAAGQASADAPTGFFPVDVATGTAAQGMGMGGSGNQRLSTTGALDYLHTLDPDQTREIQKKLAAAGYYEKVGKGGFEDGYQWDTNTDEAWRLALADSIRQGKPVDQVIAGEVSRFQGVLHSRQGQAGSFDHHQATAALNGYLHDIIGRDLSPREASELNVYVTNLRRTAAGYVAGVDDQAIARVDPEAGYDVGAFTQHVDQQFGAEEADNRFFDNMQFLKDKYSLKRGQVPPPPPEDN